jgi:hypothetical protein
MEMVREFVKEKETKNTVKYEEKPPVGQPPVMGTLYLQKWAANGAEKVTVTITIPE